MRQASPSFSVPWQSLCKGDDSQGFLVKERYPLGGGGRSKICCGDGGEGGEYITIEKDRINCKIARCRDVVYFCPCDGGGERQYTLEF